MKRGLLASLGLGLLTPSMSQALNLTNVNVEMAGCGVTTCQTVAGNQWNQAELDWHSALSGAPALAAGQQLIFTQTGNLNSFFGFNFDTSEAPTTPNASITFTIGGSPFVFNDNTILAEIGGGDPNSTATNETHNWTQIGSPTSIGGGLAMTVYVGYADNLHTNGCPGGVSTPPYTACFPSVWAGSPGVTLFAGSGAPSPIGQGASGWTGIVNPALTPCGGATDPITTTDCFDAGAIRIVISATTPEPSTLLLFGIGLLGVASWGRRYSKKQK